VTAGARDKARPASADGLDDAAFIKESLPRYAAAVSRATARHPPSR
jgi:hypothetical protein